jgi:hypothetical protein
VVGVVLVLMAATTLFACGEATDQPEDCRPGEFFNEANESCDACPAIIEPQCRQGCGFEIVTPEDRGDLSCAIAECADPCLCQDEPGQFFDEATLSCENCETATDPPRICAEQTDDS